MTRRSFLSLAALPSLAAALPQTEDNLAITAVRIVRTRPKRPVPAYTPSASSWSTHGVETANPLSMYPKYKPSRNLFRNEPTSPLVGDFTVEIETNKGIKGYGNGGPAGGPIVKGHLEKLLLGENALDIERIWDILFRATMSYGRKGPVIHAISAVDIALWDIAGKAWGRPVWRLLGGRIHDRVPAYCTGNDFEQHAEFGYKRLKIALIHGPADGREGIRKNIETVKQARAAVGPEGDVMVDCWMALTERYTLELAEALEPLNVYWLEECLPPDDFEGFGRLREQITSTRIVTGEHLYTRYDFRQLLRVNGAEIWQPDVKWCGGLTELRRIAAMAAAHDIPVIPHSGGQEDAIHFIYSTPNAPWAEMFMPPPGGPPVVYERYEQDYNLTRGPEGIYRRPSDTPGIGWDIEVTEEVKI